MTEEIPSGEETATGEAETITVVALEVATAVLRKCIQQCVLTVALRPRFHSNRLKEDRFTAGIVYQNTGSSNSKFYIFDF
jgi:hypothetical protein